MLPNYFDYIFVHLRQKARLRPELSPKFLSTLGSSPAQTRPGKPGPTKNSASIRASSLTQLNMIRKRLILHIFYDIFHEGSGGLPG